MKRQRKKPVRLSVIPARVPRKRQPERKTCPSVPMGCLNDPFPTGGKNLSAFCPRSDGKPLGEYTEPELVALMREAEALAAAYKRAARFYLGVI